MPLRGETIGVAYVKILADGGDFGRGIRREMDKAEPEIEKGARSHSDAYAEEWNKRLSDKDLGKGLRDSLDKSWAKAHTADSYFGSRDWTIFKSRLKHEFGVAGELAGEEMEREFRHNADGIFAATENINRRVAKIAAGMEKEWRKQTDAITVDMAKTRTALRRTLTDYDNDIQKVRGSIAQFVQNHARMGQAIRDLPSPKGFFNDLMIGARNAGNSTERERSKIDLFGDSLAKAFGKGSRNDFINFMGSFMALPIRAIGGIAQMASGLKDWVTRFQQLEGMGQKLGAIGAAVGELGAAAVAGIAVIGFVIGPVISLVASLAGAVIALAGSISFALVGALGALAGALLPLALGFGVAILAIKNMDKATKNLVKTALKPLTAEFKTLGEIAAKGMFSNIREQAGKFTGALKEARPLVRGIGTALSNVGDSFADMVSGPPYHKFINTMTKFIPDAIATMGRIFGHTGEGIMGVFRGLVPITQKFLGWLDKLTGSFSNWANSAKGQSQMKTFFERAENAASALWDLIKSLGADIIKLFDAGEPAGTSMIDSLADKFTEWGDWLDAHPDALKKWFGDAKKIAGDVGDTVLKIIDIVDKLDSPENREKVHEFIKILNEVIAAVGFIVGAFNKAAAPVSDGFAQWSALGEKVRTTFNSIKTTVGNVASAIGEAFNTAKTKVSNAFGAIRDKAALVIGSVVGFFTRLPGRIGKALAGIGAAAGRAFGSLRERASTVVGNVASFFRKLPGRIATFLARLPGLANKQLNKMAFAAGFAVGRIVRFFVQLPGKIGGALSRLGTAIRSKFLNAVQRIPPLVERIRIFFTRLPGKIGAALGRLAGVIRGKFSDGANKVPPIVERIRNFFAQLPGKIGRAIASVVGIIRSKFSDAASKVPAIVTRIVGFFRGLGRKIGGAIGSLWSAISDKFHSIPDNVRGVVSSIVNVFSGLGGRILNAIGSINVGSLISWPAGKLGQIARGFVAGSSATGGVYAGAQVRLIGEAGPEAIVPLRRPLSQVDPAVRELSAIAQGLTPPGAASGGVTGGTGKTVNVGGISIYTPTIDPAAVAQETINHLVGVGY